VHNHEGPLKHVLIVEDDDRLREVLEDLLSAAGYRPIATQDGLEALDLARLIDGGSRHRRHPHAHLDGPELIKRVRQTTRWAGIPVLVLSAYANLDRYRNLPVDGFQLKPFHLSELLEKVQQLIGPSDA